MMPQCMGAIVALLCSTGWITTWGEAMANTSAQLMMQTLTEIVEYGNNTGSVSLYMAHGGTNFGYWAGPPPPPRPRLKTEFQANPQVRGPDDFG
jgi:hypothetical protein